MIKICFGVIKYFFHVKDTFYVLYGYVIKWVHPYDGWDKVCDEYYKRMYEQSAEDDIIDGDEE